uniref:Uncharacterized protein n=1 Tax=Anguilla anguilla TaxID=7936 RepID=A0A0E9PH30_ANGAN
MLLKCKCNKYKHISLFFF